LVRAWLSVFWSPSRSAISIARPAQPVDAANRKASMSSCAWLLYAIAPADHRAKRMVGRQLVVTIRDDQQRARACSGPSARA
jgi:hypothetical protein